MKKLLIPLAFLILIIVGGVIENRNIHSKFDIFMDMLIELSDKIDSEDATTEDVKLVDEWWRQEKKIMNTYMPHSEFREIEFWLAETASYISTDNYDHAKAKLETLIAITKSIPHSFDLSLENIC